MADLIQLTGPMKEFVYRSPSGNNGVNPVVLRVDLGAECYSDKDVLRELWISSDFQIDDVRRDDGGP